MAIDFDRFLEWAENRFSDIVVKGDEIKLNSVFCDDVKHHLWCNPTGGKNDRPNGVFHCWKTDTKGSLVTLVMYVDNCGFEEALEILGGSDTNLRALEKKVAELFTEPVRIDESPDLDSVNLKLPPYSYAIDDLPSVNYHRVHAEAYLLQRRLPSAGLFVSTGGEYKNRIIIPYYDHKKQLIYYNGRYIGDSDKVMRYLGPPKEIGIGKGDVLFVPQWPQPGERLYLTEGELDALSLCISGCPSAAFGGKSLTERQIELLRQMDIIPILALDADKVGRQAISRMGEQLLSAPGFRKSFGYVKPPVEDKDWNALLQRLGPRIVKQYVKNKTQVYDEWTATALNTQSL